MDSDRFDDLARALVTQAPTRRTVLRRLTTAALGGLTGLVGGGQARARPNCQTPGTACPGSTVCVNGACVPAARVSCPPGRVCGKACCGPAEVCVNGTCVGRLCPPGEVLFEGRCCTPEGAKCHQDGDCCLIDDICSTGCSSDATCYAGSGLPFTTEGNCCPYPSRAYCCCPDRFTGKGGGAGCCDPNQEDCSIETLCGSNALGSGIADPPVRPGSAARRAPGASAAPAWPPGPSAPG